jgi:hypothetical protein
MLHGKRSVNPNERTSDRRASGPGSSITWPTLSACRSGPAHAMRAARLRRWHASLQALEAEGGVFWTVTLIMVAGRKA